MVDRIQYEGDLAHLDELMVHGADVRVEALSYHEFALTVVRPDGLILRLSVQDVRLVDSESAHLLTTAMIDKALGCGHEWTTRRGTRHMCDNTGTTPHAKMHVCECGATNPLKEKK